MIHLIDGNNRFRARWEKLGPNALRIMYNESISNIQSQQDTKIIWVWDGLDGTQSRRDIYPNYKGGPRSATDQFHETTKLFKQLLTHSNCLQLTVDGYEADDVIATIARTSNDKVFIDSNDADFLALMSERVAINREPLPVLPEFIPLYKTLVGDKSDNIKGLPGFGETAWKKLQDSERVLLISHFEGTQKFEGQDCIELFGWTKNQAAKWDENQALLKQYWSIVQFFDVPFELIQKNLQVGNLDYATAEKLFVEFALDMDNHKAA